MLKWTMGINADAKVDIKELIAKVKFTLLNGFLVKEMMFYICTLPKSPVSLQEIRRNGSPDFWAVPVFSIIGRHMDK